MPTSLPRIQVTLTPELDRAVAQARQLWPNRPTSQLVATLATAGATALETANHCRRDALRQTRGIFQGAYPEGYLDELRQDWA